jgi:3-oxoacyl-[acyl-carrier protein] reductase
MSSSKRRVLITGASRGIGRSVALELARADFSVALNYRSGVEAAESLAAEIRAAGGEAVPLGFDVADREASQVAIEADIAENGAYYGAVINAGITDDAPMAALKGEAWDRVLRTNLDGFYNVMQPLLMPMVRLRQGGRVVCMSSFSGVKGNRGQVNYSASKAGLIGATRSLALEVAKRGITANCVAPGFIETDMLAGLPAGLVDVVPLKRMGQPEEVAGLVGFLFSEGAGYMTGQVISIDGGMA